MSEIKWPNEETRIAEDCAGQYYAWDGQRDLVRKSIGAAAGDLEWALELLAEELETTLRKDQPPYAPRHIGWELADKAFGRVNWAFLAKLMLDKIVDSARSSRERETR